jgi:hypothetical protein
MTENLSHNNWYTNQYSNQAPPEYKRNFRFSQRDRCCRERIVLNSYNKMYCSFSFFFITAIEISNAEIIILDTALKYQLNTKYISRA